MVHYIASVVSTSTRRRTGHWWREQFPATRSAQASQLQLKTRITARSARRNTARSPQEELLAALKAAQVRSIRDWAMILTGYKHALRASEIAALTLDDLHDGCLDIK